MKYIIDEIEEMERCLDDGWRKNEDLKGTESNSKRWLSYHVTSDPCIAPQLVASSKQSNHGSCVSAFFL